jgi:hypothetical protein
MWWAASNVLEPYKHLNYYVGIYVMLGILALIFLIVSCWSVIGLNRAMPKTIILTNLLGY